MRILIIGDAGSIFIKQFVEYVHCDDKDNDIVILQEGTVNDDYKEFYMSKHITLESIEKHSNSFLYKIPKIRSIYAIKIFSKYLINKYKYFDMIHIHGLNYSRGNLGMYLSKITDKLIITVWGDEIFRKNNRILKSYKKYYEIADIITVSTIDMYKKFISEYGNKYDRKIKMNKFALGILDMIDENKSNLTKKDLCNEFGFNYSNKKMIFVGHNGREAQRHFEITKEISKLSKETLSNIVLVYTMTYGVKNKEYLLDLEKEVKKLGCEYYILTDFLNEEKTSKLRLLCDVMLHAQLTDAFSASLMESLYAGAIIINGSWLVYNDLPNCHERFVEYNDMDTITNVLIDVLDNFEIYKNKFVDNRQVIYNLCSRSVTTLNWKNSLYK